MTTDVKMNPLLDRLRIPGETFRLPSHGVFYEDGELAPDVKNGEVEVYPMTARDEIILSTPDKLLSGKAILEIFSRCIPQVLKPGQLLSKDVDFLMVCLRYVSFGPTMEISYQHDCENAKVHTYNVDMQSMIKGTRSVDPTTVLQDFTSSLPNGQTVVMKPLTYTNVVDLYQNVALTKSEDLSQQEAETLIIHTLASVIKRVDDVTDPEMIREWVSSLPLGWKRTLERAAQGLGEWGTDFNTKQVCKDCKKEFAVQISANPVNFFM